MLVISLREDKLGNGHQEYHVFRRAAERARLSPAELLRAISDINLYLPDDWRLARSGPTFRIHVQAGGKNYALVGSSYRGKEGEILHIVDTVYDPAFVDSQEYRSLPKREQQRYGGFTQELKKAHPQLMAPNLYYFRPVPDDMPGPLFARQYEKVNEQGLLEYHRLHPLTQYGLDPDHFRWVKWDVLRGVATFAPYPPEGFHGKDFFAVPELARERERGSQQQYVEAFGKLVSDSGATGIEEPENPPSPYEHEYKFVVADDWNPVWQHVVESLNTLGMKMVAKDDAEQNDVYFDDDRLSLFRRGASFRLRTRRDASRITLKARPAGTERAQTAEYTRIEEEVCVSPEQCESLLAGRPVQALPYRLIAYVLPDCGPLAAVARVVTQRKTVTLENEGGQNAELCLDIVRYMLPDSDAPPDGQTPDTEIELESKGLPRDDLAAVAALIGENRSVTPSSFSKYERAVKALGLERTQN